VRAQKIYAGTNEIMKEIVAQALEQQTTLSAPTQLGRGSSTG
jgi:hypothetical protein